jgi:guanylate kinase
MAAAGPWRLVILSGPSCVGKSPLRAALAKFHSGLWGSLEKLVLFNSRSPRPGEREGVDYHFRSRAQVEELRLKDGYVVLDVRGDLQAVDVAAVKRRLGRGNAFFEGNPFVGRLLQTHPLLADVDRLSMFLSPLSKEEIVCLRAAEPGLSLRDLVTDVMRRKLLRRTRHQKGEPSLPDLENIETRARSAYRELSDAWLFQHVIPNHDGEDSENWDAFYYPIGDARKALQAVVALLEGMASPPDVERWDEDLVPAPRQ